MTTGVFEQLKNLYDQQLYSNVVALASLLTTVSDHNPEFMPAPSKFQCYVYFGDSLFHLRQFRKAECVYRKALQFKSSVLKAKGTKPQEGTKELMPDIDIKYQIHLCLGEMKQTDQAITILQSIPAKQRSAKIYMALGKLYQLSGLDRSAISAFKEVLRECPLAVEAAEELLSLGVKGAEVASLMIEGTSCHSNMEWLSTFIRGEAQLYAREYLPAVSTLRSLNDHTCLRDNVNLLVVMGQAQYYQGDRRNALITLQRAHSLDPYMNQGLDTLAAVLSKEKKVKELEKLVPPNLSASEYTPETWIATAYYSHATKRNMKAVYFAHKACCLSPRNVEAMILKGNILLQLKKFPGAMAHFRDAMHHAPYRYEPYRGLVDCYIANHRMRAAVTTASNACKELGQTPRTLTLYASVLMKDPVTVVKAKGLLEKALAQDRHYLPAVYLLAEILEQEARLEPATRLLQRQVEIQPTCRLHQMLGDLLARTRQEERALHHYSLALNLDPNNRRALEGLHRIDHSAPKLDSAYYMSVEEEGTDTTFDVGGIVDSENEADADESEDIVWSDVEVGMNSS